MTNIQTEPEPASFRLRNVFPRTALVDAADGSGHKIYYEQYGPRDKPALFLIHGNAGYIFDRQKLSMCDFEEQHVVIIHARGIGKSQPHGLTTANLYPGLMQDIETVRLSLSLEKIRLFGWSGGTSISLLYAQNYPENCLDLTLYGTYLGTPPEILAYYENLKMKYPVGWDRFSARLNETDTLSLIRKCNQAILNGNWQDKLDAVIAYEGIFANVGQSSEDLMASKSLEDWGKLVQNRIIFSFMMENNYGLTDSQLEKGLIKIADMPILFINGEHDHVTPPETVVPLMKNLNNATQFIVADAGHEVHDPVAQNALRYWLTHHPKNQKEQPPFAMPIMREMLGSHLRMS